MQYEERHAINGTFSLVYMDGQMVAEATALKAEVKIEFMQVNMCGDLAKHQKVSGVSGTGSLVMTKINSRMAIALSDKLKIGEIPRFTIMSVLQDPDAAGTERVVLKNCYFDSLTLADWAANKIVEITQPFNFTDWEFLDMIDV